MSFLENLFFGNVDLQARVVKTGSRADKLRTYITDHLPEIENALPDVQRGVLEKIMDAQGVWTQSRSWIALSSVSASAQRLRTIPS